MFGRKRLVRVGAFAVPLLVVVTLLASGCGGSTTTIDTVKLEKSDLPGWTLVDETEVTTENAAPGSIIKELYDAGAVGILNQTFEKGGDRLQVNYVEMEDETGGGKAVSMLKEAVDGANTVVAKGNVAIEIIGTPADREMVEEKLGGS